MSPRRPSICHETHCAADHCHCCPSGGLNLQGFTRRSFLGGAAFGAAALGAAALQQLSLAAAEPAETPAPKRKPLVVKPVLLYSTYKRRQATSWRPWGGIQTPQDVEEETVRIRKELDALQRSSDFPVRFLPLSKIRRSAEAKGLADIKSADTVLVYAAAGDNLDSFETIGKDVIIFVRWRSGPVYLWYEIVSPRFLRHHSDTLSVKGIDNQDVVVDSQDDIRWRLRALGGLKNTRGSRIVALGGPSGWATPKAPELSRDRWGLDIRTVSYEDLGKLIQAARKDDKAVKLARRRAAEYLAQDGITLETDKGFVERAFLLEQIFRSLMAAVDARAFTINQCMGTIMRYSDTTACLPLSTLNDSGYLAYCESDFVVVPAGILANNISGRPPFLNDPTFPAHGIITLAHCTGPRKMDGKNFEPARIMTHFESDYGASPKVEMHKGQELTCILPDFRAEKWIGLRAEIADAPFLPICRSQIDVSFRCDSDLLARKMPGFHWMTVYGDYRKEIGYALKKTKIRWENLG